MRRAHSSPVKTDIPLPGPTSTAQGRGRGFDLTACQVQVVNICGAFLAIVLAGPGMLLPADQAGPRRANHGNEAVRQALAAKVDIDVLNLPLREFVPYMAKRLGGPVVLGKAALRRAEVNPALEITASFKQVPLGVALRQILRPLKLEHRVVDGGLLIEDVGEVPDELPRPATQIRVGQVALERQAWEQVLRFNRQKAKGIDALVDLKVLTPLVQVRTLLRLELDFVRRACQPRPQQEQRLQDTAWQQVGEALANWQTDNGAPVPSYAREVIQDEVLSAVRTTLSPAQVARYEAEAAKRKAFRNLACARNLLVTLDGELLLTPKQREELCTALSQNWDDAWTVSLATTSTNERGLIPAVPDELMMPHLDALQCLLWRRLPKTGKLIWRLDQTAFLGLPPLDAGDLDVR
jgi:hypothetical protein